MRKEELFRVNLETGDQLEELAGFLQGQSLFSFETLIFYCYMNCTEAEPLEVFFFSADLQVLSD